MPKLFYTSLPVLLCVWKFCSNPNKELPKKKSEKKEKLLFLAQFWGFKYTYMEYRYGHDNQIYCNGTKVDIYIHMNGERTNKE